MPFVTLKNIKIRCKLQKQSKLSKKKLIAFDKGDRKRKNEWEMSLSSSFS